MNTIYSRYMRLAVNDNNGEDLEAVAQNFQNIFNVIASEEGSQKISSVSNGAHCDAYRYHSEKGMIQAACYPNGFILIILLRPQGADKNYDYLHSEFLKDLKEFCD